MRAAVVLLLLLTRVAEAGPVVCDEVESLLDVDGHCGLCSGYGYKKKQPPATRLTSDQVKRGVKEAVARARACGDEHPGRGTVKVRVVVRPAGTVERTSVERGPKRRRALDSCVAAAMRTAAFPRTDTGATFTYPLRF